MLFAQFYMNCDCTFVGRKRSASGLSVEEFSPLELRGLRAHDELLTIYAVSEICLQHPPLYSLTIPWWDAKDSLWTRQKAHHPWLKHEAHANTCILSIRPPSITHYVGSSCYACWKGTPSVPSTGDKSPLPFIWEAQTAESWTQMTLSGLLASSFRQGCFFSLRSEELTLPPLLRICWVLSTPINRPDLQSFSLLSHR